MRGEFTSVWSESWHEIWEDLAAHEAAPIDLFLGGQSRLLRSFGNQAVGECN